MIQIRSNIVRAILRRCLFIPFVNVMYGTLYILRRNIQVVDSVDTIDFIIKNKCSVSRYGDGEINMIIQLFTADTRLNNVTFQVYDKMLAERLFEIIAAKDYDNNQHIVCIPYWFKGNVGIYKPEIRYWCKKYFAFNWHYISRILNKKREYFNANITRFYMSYVDKSGCADYVGKMKKIWEGRHVCIVEGKYSRLGVGNDLFSNTTTIVRILCPARNAFSQYDKILECVIKNVSVDALILIALGHTATVLAYDLSIKGYQAIDLGHVDVEYEWMLMGATSKTPLENKYVNEAGANNAYLKNCGDLAYCSQIVAEIV